MTRIKWLHGSTRNGLLRVLEALQEQAPAAAASAAPAPLPPAVAGVVVCMEATLALGVGQLLLFAGAAAAAVTRAALRPLVGHQSAAPAAADIASLAVFLSGALSFAGWFFQADRRALVRDLGLLRLPRASIAAVATLAAAQTLVVAATALIERWLRRDGTDERALFAWRSGGALLPALVLAPLREELFFRGLVFLLVWNRLGAAAVRRSAALASALFALVHLANARGVGAAYSRSYVAYQSSFAMLVGVFLSLRLAVSRSLLECVLLHAVTNGFAQLVDARAPVDFADPLTLAAGASSPSLLFSDVTSAADAPQC